MMGIDSCGMIISAIHHEEGEERLNLLMVCLLYTSAVFKGWLHRGALRDGERFEAWLTRILVNECRNIQRRWKKRAEPLDEARAAALEQPPPDPALYDALMSLSLIHI